MNESELTTRTVSTEFIVKKNIGIIYSERGTKLVRVLHDYEIWEDNWRPGMPQVHPMFPNHFSNFGAPWQWCSRRANPRITDLQWTKIYTGQRFVSNDQGFEMPDDPRNNYILGKTGFPEDPRVENLTTGGSVHLGYFEGSRFYFTAMLNVNGNVPTQMELDLNPWHKVIATSCDGNQKPRRFPQGELPNGEIATITHPFLVNRIRFPVQYTDAYRVAVWGHSWLPDPFTIYGRRSPLLHHG